MTRKAHSWQMSQTPQMQFQIIEVTTDDLVEGRARKQLWIAAAAPEEAITLVLDAVPEGWTATLAGGRVTPEQIALLKLKPGDVRELTK